MEYMPQDSERVERVMAMNTILHTLYPDPRIDLTFRNPWELLVAVVLSAQCTDARVNTVTPVLHARYPSVSACSTARLRDIETIIFSCGYYRSKARYIRDAARRIVSEYQGEVPRTMEALLTIPGVGRKTANVVLSCAFGINHGIAVDTHVRRFAIRFDLTRHTEPIPIEQDLMRLMPQEEWWGFNHRLVCYGRDVCPARPHQCAEHPLTRLYPDAQHSWPKASKYTV